MFTPRCSQRIREFPRSGELFSTTYGCGLRGVKVAHFSDFVLFSPYKTPKTYLPVTSLQPRGYIAACGSRRSKGVFSGRGVFLRLLVGELEIPKLVQIFAYGKWLYQCRMLLQGASDLDQICLKTRSSEDGCTFPQISSSLHPKLPQNPILRDLSMQSLLYTELSVSRTLMELRS